MMKAKIYSNKILIGESILKLTDESMGVVSGKFIPNENYKKVKGEILKFHSSKANNKFEIPEKLRINCQLENEIFLNPLGGFLITDIEEIDDIEFEVIGIYRHIIEDYFIDNKPVNINEPWGTITISQKISYEDELYKEIGKFNKRNIFNFLKLKKHELIEYSFSAFAKLSINDNVLFSIYKKGENKFDYAVIKLTWKGKLEKNNFPRTEFYLDYKDFTNKRLELDKKDYEE